jgi:hypothetical protein
VKFILPIVALLGATNFPYTYKYHMVTCPAGAQSSQCDSAQTCAAGSCSGSSPTTSTNGMTLGGVRSFRITICAASGNTLSGAGTMQAWGFSNAEGIWVRNSDLDLTVSLSTRCQRWADLLTGVSYDRVDYISNAVTVSGGSTLDVMIEGQSREQGS